MQPIGNAWSHNYHELMPEDIFNALNNLLDPQCVIKVKNEIYAVIPAYISSFNEPLMVIIELNSGLIINKNANVNKIVTIYPKSNLSDYLEKLDEKEILYKKMSINTGSNCLNWILYRSKMYLFMGPVFSSPLFFGSVHVKRLCIDITLGG